MRSILQELHVVNERHLMMLSRLSEFSENIPPKHYEYMVKILEKEYESEVKELIRRHTLERITAEFRLNHRLGTYTPRGWWIFKNRMAKLIEKQLEEEAKKFFQAVAQGMPIEDCIDTINQTHAAEQDDEEEEENG